MQALILEDNIGPLMAEEILREGSAHLSWQQVYNLKLLATGSEDEAEEAVVRHEEARLRQGDGPTE